MIVPDELRKCVVFVAIPLANGGPRLVGTAFLVSREIPGSEEWQNYLITAKHVIDGIRGKGVNKVLIRLNMTGDESAWMETEVSNWMCHPTDNSVDVAVFATGLPNGNDHRCYPTSWAATPEMIAEEQIGLGTEVFLVGLFAHHSGQRKNIPIVRIGNIAAMPEEKVDTKIGKIDAYLVEARSIGGLSGSPVFANLGVVRMREGNPITGGQMFYLLGLMHGHWDADFSKPDEVIVDTTGIQRVNMGIGIVVPFEKIMEVINQ